ncbi:MAG: hypothetical protein JSV77_07605 [Dehalococcoidales bacterium]|nr:MAG: hypothetical protein JSV77_07605 [Dehalococcoidales bacterium]
MMAWAETAAKEHGITREEVDKWALASNQRACAAMSSGKFNDEIISVSVPQRRGEPIVVTDDERPRSDTSLEALARLRPVMDGVCTAGNSSGENDGASVCTIMLEKGRRIITEADGPPENIRHGRCRPALRLEISHRRRRKGPEEGQSHYRPD